MRAGGAAGVKKKLIEVALPLEPLNVACKADKDRKTGSIRNLHKSFAPMPVPALRALIFAALVDDPGDDRDRDHLLELIERLAASVVEAPDPSVLAEARSRIRSSFPEGELPPVFDPFCGGGSTLVEAQRLGLDSTGSDLNPVAVLISRLLTQYGPVLRDHPGVAVSQTAFGVREPFGGFKADVRSYAARVRALAFEAVGSHYPLAPNGDPVSAWLWPALCPARILVSGVQPRRLSPTGGSPRTPRRAPSCCPRLIARREPSDFGSARAVSPRPPAKSRCALLQHAYRLPLHPRAGAAAGPQPPDVCDGRSGAKGAELFCSYTRSSGRSCVRTAEGPTG